MACRIAWDVTSEGKIIWTEAPEEAEIEVELEVDAKAEAQAEADAAGVSLDT